MSNPHQPRFSQYDDPRNLPGSPWMGMTAAEQMETISPALNVLRAIHHWHVLNNASIQSITGYSSDTVRWALAKLLKWKQIEALGYVKGTGGKSHSLYFVPSRKGPKRLKLPFFHPVRTHFIRPVEEAGWPGSRGLVQIGRHSAIRLHTLMIPKVVAWVMNHLDEWVIPLPEYVLRKELGWYADWKKPFWKVKADPLDLFKFRRLVETAIPDAYLVASRFAIRVELELHRKSFARYEEIFKQIREGELVFFVVDSTSLYTAIRDFVKEKGFPVCPIRWLNQADLDAALARVEQIQADGVWKASRYRSGIVYYYERAILDPSLCDPSSQPRTLPPP